MTKTSPSKPCNHCGQDPESPRTGKPLISFDGTLQEMNVRKVVAGTPPNPSQWIYDALFGLTGSEPPIPAQIHRHNKSSLPSKLGRTFEVNGATLRFENGEPPPESLRSTIAMLRNHDRLPGGHSTIANDKARELLHWITSMQIQLAQTRMVIQVSDVKEAG